MDLKFDNEEKEEEIGSLVKLINRFVFFSFQEIFTCPNGKSLTQTTITYG